MSGDGRLRAAIAQVTAAVGDVRANLSQVSRLLEEAARDRAGLVCFPELCLPGYLLDPAGYDSRLLAELDRADRALQADARRLEVRVIYGTARRRHGQLHNVVTIVEPDGSRADYAKVHMVETERRVFAAGQELVLAGDGDLGLGCCYDLAFPVFCAQLASAGATVLAFPMAWERERAFVFEGIVRARAIENVAFVLCANQAGAQGTRQFHGRSRIIGPLGETVAEAGDEAGLRAADLDLRWVDRLRSSADQSTYPLLADRLPAMPVRRGPGPARASAG